jgi:hypothetical protein
MKTNLRFHRVLVGRERTALYQNLVPRRCRTVERHHHQMQIYRERIHHHHFLRFCTHKFRRLLSEQSVIWHPRIPSAKMSLHTQLGPVFQFLLNVRGSTPWLQTERMAAQVNAIGAIDLGNEEKIAVLLERIVLIHRDGEVFV